MKTLLEDDVISLEDACEILSISTATGRNWIKSGVLKPANPESKKWFTRDHVESVLNDIKGGATNRLQSRRNKKHISGSHVSKKYLESKGNYDLVRKIIENLEDIEVTQTDIRIILAEYAVKLFYSRLEIFNNRITIEDDYKKYHFAPLIEFLLENQTVNLKSSLIKNVLEYECKYESDDFLGLLYMSLQNLKARKDNGVYYTPVNIVSSITETIGNIGKDKGKLTVLDPCCGTGNFLISAFKNGFSRRNLYGYDIDDISVAITRINLALLDIEDEDIKYTNNILCMDSLVNGSKDTFDFVIGNPPWGSSVLTSDNVISRDYESYKGGPKEAFALFLERGIQFLKPKTGLLSYVVPEALINVGIHKNIRQYLIDNTNLKKIAFWGNAFDGVQSPSISIYLEKNKKEYFAHMCEVITEKGSFTINEYRHFNSDLWVLKYQDNEVSLIQKMENSKVFYLKDKSRFALGIVTGDNKKYVLSNQIEGSKELLKGSDIYKFKFQTPKNFILYTPEKFQQVAKEDFYFAKEKLFYRFISDTLVFSYDDRQTLSLNSANILIPQVENYPVKYIMAILNSRLAHFYFKSKYNSVKILRNHIESIPIYSATEQDIKHIVELVDKILIEDKNNQIESIYNEMDDYILNMYGLTDEEKQLVMSFNSNNIFLLP